MSLGYFLRQWRSGWSIKLNRQNDIKARNERIARFSVAVNIVPGTALHAAMSDPSGPFKISKLSNPKDLQDLAVKIAIAFEKNGPDLYVDRYIRKFLKEYNSRIFAAEGRNQPLSFNIMRSFVDPDDRTLVFGLLDEQHYIVKFEEFLDFITTPNANAGCYSKDEFDELTIYEVNMWGGQKDFVIPGEDKHIFCGGGYVLDGDEISILGVFGERVDSHAEKIVEINREYITKGKENLVNKTNANFAPEGLFGQDGLQPLLIMTRIDVRTGTRHVRYALREAVDSFSVVTDDPTPVDDLRAAGKDVSQEMLDNSQAELGQLSSLFSILELLPSFSRMLDARQDDLTITRYPTGIKMDELSAPVRKAREALGSRVCPLYREVTTIKSAGTASKGTFTVSPIGLKVEQTGFWKTLPIGKLGSDKNGGEVFNKTWVTQDRSWVEVEVPGSHFAFDVNVSSVENDNIGYLYVMRNPSHAGNIYKVGFTQQTAEQRAKELSGSTGQPDAFVVMQEWLVRDPRAVEYQVHKALGAYRLKDRREFFRLRYKDLRSVVETVLAASGAEIDEALP